MKWFWCDCSVAQQEIIKDTECPGQEDDFGAGSAADLLQVPGLGAGPPNHMRTGAPVQPTFNQERADIHEPMDLERGDFGQALQPVTVTNPLLAEIPSDVFFAWKLGGSRGCQPLLGTHISNGLTVLGADVHHAILINEGVRH